MKRLFVALLLVASASLVRADDITLRIIGDARQPFKAMMSTDKLLNGMNLIRTDQSGVKLWAELKKDGESSVINWILTDMAGARLPSSTIRIQNTQNSEEKCMSCTEPKTGPRVCTEVDCQKIRIPCCQPGKPLRCCIK
ncbi:MAG TPA: hypothetical protein VGA10_06540 [Thermoanaerobaculia bacterium]